MNRRLFLRGAASTLWLPLLPSVLPREARAAAPADPRRLVFLFVPNGLLHDYVTPTTLGAGYPLPTMLSPLAPLQDRVTVVSGLENRASVEPSGYGTHEGCLSSLLSDHTLGDAYNGSLDGGITVDQAAAAAIGAGTPFPSLQLATGEPSISAFGNLGIYYSTLSWAGPQSPVAPLIDPKTTFDRMFAGTDPAATEAEIERRDTMRRSVLDAVLERTQRLQSRVNAEDRAKLDQFTTGVRELELRVQALAELECPVPEEPVSSPGFAQKVEAFLDLMVVALQCDYTRVLTFMGGPSTAMTSFPFLGISADHHTLSHDQAYSDPRRAELLAIQQWYVQQYATLCDKLAQVPTADGDLLGSSLVSLVTEFADSNLHTAQPMTFLLAGGEKGGVLQGRHRLYGGLPHGNLLRSMLDFVGADSSSFGQHATGSLDLSVEA